MRWRGIREKSARGESTKGEDVGFPLSSEILLLSNRLREYGVTVTLDFKDLLKMNPTVIQEWQTFMTLVSAEELDPSYEVKAQN